MDLGNINYRLLQVRYALAFQHEDIDELYYANIDVNQGIITKCSVGSSLFSHLVASGKWITVDLYEELYYPLYRIEVVGKKIGHSFCLVSSSPDCWYLVHCYLNNFSLTWTPIDIQTFIRNLRKLENSFNPTLWKELFSVDELGFGEIEFFIQGCVEIDLEMFQQRINEIDNKISQELSNPNSYLYSDEYHWILQMSREPYPL